MSAPKRCSECGNYAGAHASNCPEMPDPVTAVVCRWCDALVDVEAKACGNCGSADFRTPDDGGADD